MSSFEIISLASDSLLRIQDVADRVGMGKSSIYRLVQAGKFPQPIHISPKMTRWRSSEIAEWIEALAQARSTPDQITPI